MVAFTTCTRIFTVSVSYTPDAADERSSVDLGGRRIIKKKKHRVKIGVVHILKQQQKERM